MKSRNFLFLSLATMVAFFSLAVNTADVFALSRDVVSPPILQTLHVDDDAVCPGSGTIVYPYCKIQDAIDAAADGDEVLVHDGTYRELLTFDGSKEITVRSENGPDKTIINGDTDSDGTGDGSVVSFIGGDNSTLDGFTITKGTGTPRPWVNGGGIYCLRSSPTITNCVISGNSAAKLGGGIWCYDSSSLTLTNCTISGNSAEYGGGIFCGWFTSSTITNCIISGNTALKFGGGINCNDESATAITNSIISGNTANKGGGVYCFWETPLTITNSTISGNSADSGGGINIEEYSTLAIVNSILWGNEADGSLNEIHLQNVMTYTGVIPATINYSNINPSLITITDSNPFSPSTSHNINDDPLFVNAISATSAPTTSGNYHLQLGSPCIDKGTGEGAPSDDIDGDSRPQLNGYDMGADEYIGNNCTDEDGDGFSIEGEDCGEIDCDDDDENIHPDADEACDGADNNCDEVIDEGCEPVCDSGLTSGLAALYHMNNNWTDASGNGNDCTPQGAVFDDTNAKLGSHGGSFDGIDDYIEVASNSTLNITDNITIALWVNPDIVEDEDTYLWKINAYGIAMGLTGAEVGIESGKIGFAIRSGGSWHPVSSTTTPQTGNWYHIVATYNGSSLRLYVNNSLENEVNFQGTISSNNNPLVIGGEPVIGGVRYSDSLLDEVGIWNRALSEDEIAQLYNSGDGRETSCACTDEDGDGYSIEGGDCGEIDCNDDDENINPGADEVCDGIDNDCDDDIDEYLTQVCGSDVGECRSGTQICSDGDWGECVGEIGPIAELCDDGFDNDCDADTDEPECNSPPECTSATPSIDELWSPNHKMNDINIEGVTDPDDDPISITITHITQDEPVNGQGDGNTFPDADGIGESTAQVRAERAGMPQLQNERPGPKNGRVYEISFTADDGQGGTCSGSVQVCVPHDQGIKDHCVDDGQDYNSAQWYEFDVTIDLEEDPIEICFTPDRELDADPIVTVTLDKGKGTLSNGTDTIPPEVSLAVTAIDDPCTGLLTYCVEYTPADNDSRVEIRIEEDPDNPVIPGFVASEVASFKIEPQDNSATSFCIYNITGGSGSLSNDPCDTGSGGASVESDDHDLDLKGARDENGSHLNLSDYDCIAVRITDVDPQSLPPIPNIGITGVSDISLPSGVVIHDGQTLTITLTFLLPAGMSQQEFEENLQVLYYDEDTGSWKADGISNVTIEWDTPTGGTITFQTTHLTQFAASSNSGGGGSGGDDDSGTQAATGGGCSVAGNNMSAGSALANTMLLLLPLIVLGIKRRDRGYRP